MIEREVRRFLDDLRAGRIGSAGEFTLAASPATSTVVTTQAVSANSVVLLIPKDAGGAGEWASGSLYVVPAKGSFMVRHTASATTRTFRYAVFTPVNS